MPIICGSQGLAPRLERRPANLVDVGHEENAIHARREHSRVADAENGWRIDEDEVRITNNDFRGTGVTVGGISPRHRMGIELGRVYPYGSVGASEFSNNKVGHRASPQRG